MTVGLRKDSVRGFLLFCLKLVNADEEDRKFVIREAIRKGTVKEYIGFYGLGTCTLDQQVDFILADTAALSCNVQITAELLTRGEDFVVEHTTPQIDFVGRGAKDFLSSLPWTGKGTVKYLTGEISLPGESPDRSDRTAFHWPSDRPGEDDHTRTEHVCPSSRLAEAFFHALRIYRNAKQTDFFDVPLKICEWCDKPFFGKRFDQRFCKRDHSQRWHARNAYKKRKKGESGPSPEEQPSPQPNTSTLVSYKLPQKY